jgi:importin subunit beta-1
MQWRLESGLTIQHGYIHTLAQEIANEQQDPSIRVAAGLAFKNSIQSRVRPLLLVKTTLMIRKQSINPHSLNDG